MASAVEEIKERLNIEDVIGQYVQLRRSGRNFKGISPFTNERTASFVVSPEKQIWHDFSSGKGGNVFSFVMEMEGLDFKGALELLARQSGVDLTHYQSGSSSARARDKEKLYDVLQLATKFYQTQLKSNQTALNYVFKHRQLSKEVVLDFQLGYAPNSGKALVDFLKGKGFSDAQLKAAGVAISRYQGLSDMFLGRIIVPLADQYGKTIGFTARLLNDDPDAPKYINTPQTMLYDKSRHIYGLHLAKEAIRKQTYAVVVEGNLDVIASHQAGVKQVVATAGTALTEHHLKGLTRFTSDARLCFDQDNAGIKATERAIPIAHKVGINLSIIALPSGKDPDELAHQNPDTWRETIEHPMYALDWLLQHYQQTFDTKSGQGKRQFSDAVIAVIKTLNDKVEQEHYAEKVATIVGASKEALLTKLEEKSSPEMSYKRRKVSTAEESKHTIDTTKTQDHFLALMLIHQELREFSEPITSDMLPSDQAQELLQYIQAQQAATLPDIGQALPGIEDYVKILVLQYEELYADLDTVEHRYEANRLQAQLIHQYVKTQKQNLATRLQHSDEPATSQLLEQVRLLDELLKVSKGVMHE